MIVAITALAVALAGALALAFVRAHHDARSTILDNFVGRTAFAAKTTSDLMEGSAANTTNLARKLFSGPRSTLGAAVERYASDGPPIDHAFILNARGQVLFAKPAARDGLRGLIARNPLLRDALAGGHSNSDIVRGVRGGPTIEIAVSFRTPNGRRVFGDAADIAVLQTYMGGYLKAGPAVRGAHGYLLDGHGRVLASSGAAKVGARLPDRGLLEALATRRSGEIGRRYFAAAPVAHSRWRVVFVASRSALLAPVQGSSKRITEAVFVGFVLMLALSILLAIRSMRRSAELAASRERETHAVELAHERLHDALTGLPNRALFQDRLEHALAGLARRKANVVVLFLDLDRFKRVNDSRGHGAGGELLRQVADRMQCVLRPTDTVSRFGGDEFLVVCEEIRDAEDAFRLARRLQDAVERPVEIEGREVHLTASVGMVLHGPADRPTAAADLIVAADAAMYRAKQRGRGAIEIFDAELHRRALERLDIEIGLRQAIERDELVVHYQPIVRPADGRIRGVEALVRWDRPGHGMVPPLDFIPVAEESGLIGQVGRWVLRRAAADVTAWGEQGLLPEGFTVCVNLSVRQLSDPSLAQTVVEALCDSGLPATMLCLEITESAITDDPEQALAVLTCLKELGIQLAIDDFGVGHSSLEHIARLLPVSVLKLDRSFVRAMSDERDYAIVATIASLARALNMEAVAEGVESADQARRLSELGYTLAQGFYFARPGDAASIRATLHREAAAVLLAA
jgi:diguanylate cyclase (GGDEF)-like protein